MAEKSLDIIAAGHLCLDMHPHFNNAPAAKISDILKPGTLVKMGPMTFSTGGSVSNTGFALKLFGNRVGFVAKVGDDALGASVIEIVKRHGAAEGIVIAKGETTSYTVVLSPAGIDRIFLHYPGTNDTFTVDDIDFSVVASARLFHLGYPTLMEKVYANEGRQLAAIYQKAKEAGVATSMDISLPDPHSDAGKAPWRHIYEKTLPFVDIYTPSIEEAFFTLHPEDYLRRKDQHEGAELIDHLNVREYAMLADEFLQMGCAIVALKAGHRGWFLRTADEKRLASMNLFGDSIKRWANKRLWRPAYIVETIASATGSGDTSIAAFLTAMLRGQTPEKSLAIANCAGYHCLSGMDALSGLKGWDDMVSDIPLLPLRETPFPRDSGWEWDTDESVWKGV